MAIGVVLSDRAAARIKEVVAAENREGQGLRVKVVGGGCSGLQYKVDFDRPKTTDKIFEKDGKILGLKACSPERHRIGLQRRAYAVRVCLSESERQESLRLRPVVHGFVRHRKTQK
jgi:hypothetical protein